MKEYQFKIILVVLLCLIISNTVLLPVCIYTCFRNISSNTYVYTTDSEYSDGRDDLAREDSWIAPSYTITPIVTENPIEVQNKNVYNITSEERMMLAALVYLEAGDQNIECQMAVCSVVFNRWNQGWGGAKTLHDVVYARKQFSPAYKIPYTTPTQTQLDVVDFICENGVTDPEIVFFYYKRYSNYGVPCYSIGTEYFSKAR